jgi:hypothetical protein
MTVLLSPPDITMGVPIWRSATLSSVTREETPFRFRPAVPWASWWQFLIRPLSNTPVMPLL